MVSIVDVTKKSIIKRIDLARVRILEGSEMDEEFYELAIDVGGLMDDLNKEFYEILNSFW